MRDSSDVEDPVAVTPSSDATDGEVDDGAAREGNLLAAMKSRSSGVRGSTKTCSDGKQ